MAKTEYGLELWAKPPSRDNDKSATTYAIIKPILEKRFGNSVEVFLQGSYANSTNIKQDSDIDIVICYKNSYFFDISSLSDTEVSSFHSSTSNATYTFSEFKNDVLKCLELNFGEKYTERKDKCIRVHGNGSRIDADIVPCFVHKRFKTHNKPSAEGVQFTSDEGINSVSFPKQHIQNGENKNTRTKENYKDTVRILKNCKKELVEKQLIKDELISSFFIECLVWNVPDTYFDKATYLNIVKFVVEKIYTDMQDEKNASEYAEVNDLFYLIRSGRTKTTREDVIKFLEFTYGYIFKP